MFSPAHLNLAECYLQKNKKLEAAAEIELADAFNVGDVFGVSAAVAAARRRLGTSVDKSDPVDVAQRSYISTEPLAEEDRRLIALLEGISKYAVGDAERRG